MEIIDLIESAERQQRKQVKRNVIEECQLAQVIVANISNYMSQDATKKIIMPWDLYPELFKEEKELYEQRVQEETFDDFKAKRKEYAAMMNARRNTGKEV